MRPWLAVPLALTACGRLGFDVPADVGQEGAEIDAVITVDAPLDAPGTAVGYTFGEDPVSMFGGVTTDTYISNEVGEALLNYGGDDEVRIERDSNERALLRFDVSVIPTSATVFSASLSVVFVEIPPVPMPLTVHRMLETWTEGASAGASGVANYGSRTSTLLWSSAGAGQPLSSSDAVTQFTPSVGRVQFALPPSLVQAWVTDAGENKGILIMATSDDSSRFVTSEGIPSTDRPLLSVTFVP